MKHVIILNALNLNLIIICLSWVFTQWTNLPHVKARTHCNANIVLEPIS